MYQWPVLLPALSNREDLLMTVALFDDDTGELLDVSGRTLSLPGDFIANAWTVTDGAIVTNSATQLTIKDYPFGNEMQALALVVGANLAIAPGDLVTIADTATGRNTMTGYVIAYTALTGALVVQVGSNFDFEIRGPWRGGGDGYGDCPESSYPENPIIQAQLGSGITVVDTGVIQLRIPAATIAQLRHKTYKASMLMFDGYDTRQLFIGKLPMLFGGVSSAPFAPAASNTFGLP